MSDKDEHNEDNGAPMELFWLGNLDEGNQLDADYLDEDARQHLAGLTKIDLGTRLVDLAEGEAVTGKDEDGERIEQAADALDFADEDELIEDASAPAAAPASYAAVGAALATGGAAEDEDYDFDEEEPAPGQQPPPAAPAPATTVAPPQQPQPQPTAAPLGDDATQAMIARSRGIQLPLLSKDSQGDAVLAFTDLFRSVSKQSSTAAQQRERKVRFVDAAITPTPTPTQQQPLLFPPAGENEVDKGLLLLQSGSEKLAELGIDVILQKQPLVTGTGREGLAVEEEMRRRTLEQQLQSESQQQKEAAAAAAPALLESGGKETAASGEKVSSKKPSTAATIPTIAIPAVKEGDKAAGMPSSLLSKQQQQEKQQQQSRAITAAGPSFAVLPPCVFDPVIQQIWELKINNNGGGGIFDRGVNDTSSEHETETDEDEVQKVQLDDAEGAEAGGVTEMAVDGGDGEQHQPAAMEKGEPALENEDAGEEEEEESEEEALAKKVAAEMKAAREHVTGWGAGGTDSIGADDPEDVVNVLHTAPLLRYANPLKKLFSTVANPAAPATVFAPTPAATPSTAGGEEARTSAAAGPSEGQQPAGDQSAQQQPEAAPATAAAQAEEDEEEDTLSLPILAASRVPTWESDVILEGGSAAADRLKKLPFTLDLNDSGLVLQNVAKKTERNHPEFKSLLNKSTATVIPYQKRVAIIAKGVDSTNEAVLELAKINISRDNDYFAQPKRRAGSGGVRAVHHARPAAELITIPLSLDLKELMFYHRPRGFWWPIEPAKGTRNPTYPQHSTVIIETLTGASKLTRGVELAENTPESVWQYAWDSKKRGGHPLPLFLIPGKPRPAIVPHDVRLNQSGIPMRGKETMEIFTAYRQVDLKPTARIAAVPEESNSALLRPPMAFTLAPELRAGTPGRVVVIEYLQDAPLLLNRPGMGARLATYYRRKGAADTGHQRIRNSAAEAGQRWRVGAMNPINEDDESPFLGELEPGTAQLSVETGLFTAPAAPHAPLESDFLLTRGPSGYMSVREITGAVASGQQLPLHRIPVPGSRDLKDLEERLIFVHVFRVLRDRKTKEERRLKKYEQKQQEKPEQVQGPFVPEVPCVSLKELCTLFPSRPQTALRVFIKDVCGLRLLYKDRTGDEYYSVHEGARMPSEPELRRKFTPEDACVLESCRVAEYRMQQSGLMKAVKFNYGNVAADKLRLAAEMLPPDEVTQAAAKAVEAQYITAAWNLTDAFMSSFREGRATMRLLGPGDPTGRGVGYSFVRDVRHKGTGNDDPTKAINKNKSGKVQGTDADLRRMTTEQAKKKLIDFGLDEAEIEPLGRWVRIDLVRQLANASAADGSVAGIAKYVRHQKTTLIELQKQYRERAQEIFNRQMSVLNDSAAEELGDQAALEAELEAELAAEEREDEGGEASPAKKGKKSGGAGGGRESSPSPEDEARQLEEMRAAGLLGSSPGATDATAADGAGPSTSAAAAGPKSQADASGYSGPLIPGQTRRIRREVLCRFTEDGSFQKIHEVVYTGRDRPFLLSSLYQKEGQVVTGPWGFGSRVINFSKGEKRLNYNASRGRGTGRGRGRGGGRGGGIGSRGGGGGRGSRGGRGGRRSRGEDYELYDGLDMSLAANVGSRQSRRAHAAKKKKEDYIDDEETEGIEDFEGIESEIETDDDFDAHVAELEEQGIYIVKPKKKPTQPRAPRQPRAIELGPDGQPLPKKPKQPKKEKAPLTEEQLEKQRQRQQRETSPQFVSGRDLDAMLREEGVLDDEDGPSEVIKPRVNRVRTSGTAVFNAKVASQPAVIDVGPVEWDPLAPVPAEPAPAPAATAQYYDQPQGSGDADYDIDEEDEDDEDYLGEKRRKRSGGGGGGRRTRGGRNIKSYVAPVVQPTRASSRSAAVTKKRDRYDDDVSDDELFDEDYASDMTDSPRRRRSGGGGGGGGKKKSKTSGGFGAGTAVYRSAPPRGAAGGGGAVSLVAGAKALGAVFVRILDLMKKDGEEHRKKIRNKSALTYFSIFGDPVSLSVVPDYKDKVPENKWMWLKKVRSKAVKGDYYDVESAMKDVRQIRENAKVYNDPITGGRYKYPTCIPYSEGIVKYVEEQLQTPENEHAIALALDQIEAASAGVGAGGYYNQGNGQGGGAAVENFVVDYDPFANYSIEPALPATETAPAVGGVVESQEKWILCEKCKAWRISEPHIDPDGYFECTMKNGFTCQSPLEPGGSYDEG